MRLWIRNRPQVKKINSRNQRIKIIKQIYLYNTKKKFQINFYHLTKKQWNQ